MHTNVYFSAIHSSQDREATQMSTSRGMDKEGGALIRKGVSLSHEKEQKPCPLQGREWA